MLWKSWNPRKKSKMLATNLRFSVTSGGKLVLNTQSKSGDELLLVGLEKPLPLTLNEGADYVTGWEDGIVDGTAVPITHLSVESELLGTDDGFDLQRLSLLRYRVASQALLTMPGREAGYRAERIEIRAERIERELEGVKDLLMSTETPIINEVRMVDVGE